MYYYIFLGQRKIGLSISKNSETFKTDQKRKKVSLNKIKSNKK